MLAEAHDAAPATRERFRRIVSVRKLKDRLGGDDPATLGCAINAVESELVTAGLADLALPDIPVEIAEQMRQLWHAAVSVQLDDVLKLKADAAQSVEATQAALVESNLRVDVLREELAELRGLLAARDAELAQARTDLAAAQAQLASLRKATMRSRPNCRRRMRAPQRSNNPRQKALRLPNSVTKACQSNCYRKRRSSGRRCSRNKAASHRN